MTISSLGAELLCVDRPTDGQTDRHEETNNRFSQFCERV